MGTMTAVQAGGPKELAGNLRRIAREAAELPGVRLLAKPLYRRFFQRPSRSGNVYFGSYASYDQAMAAAPPALPSSYETADTAELYHDRHQRICVSDYPMVYWLGRLMDAGHHRVFDLGGHIGVSYYGFRHYLHYPDDLRWLVHDVPAIVIAGRAWAQSHDPQARLAFTDTREDAGASDILVSSGALQYLDYTLPELLQSLAVPPAHVLVNMTPMHPHRGYFTLQNIGNAVLPYRVMAIPEFVASMESLGYTLRDRWSTLERHLRVPFEPACTIDSYCGFYFERSPSHS